MSTTKRELITHPARNPGPGRLAGAIRTGDWIHLSGQGPLDMATLEYVPGTIEEETLLTLNNIEDILKATGSHKADIIRCTCYLSDLTQFAGFHNAFQKFFGDTLPCRTTVQALLLRNIQVEIDAIAFTG